MKRKLWITLFSLLTAMLMAFTLVACGSEDKDDMEDETPPIVELPGTEGLKYAINWDGDGYMVTGIGTATETDIVIATTYEGLPVTYIAREAFRNCEQLTSVTIGANVTEIGDDAFQFCSGLQKVVFPESLTNIGDYSFWQCYALTDITLPSGLIRIGNCAFYECTSLTSIAFPKSLTSLCQSAFAGSALIEVTIPDGMTYIEEAVFSNCTSLTRVIIPTSVEDIYDWAFDDCSALESIIYRGTVEEWKSIRSHHNGWDNRTGEYTITCTDGTIAKDGTVEQL